MISSVSVSTSNISPNNDTSAKSRSLNGSLPIVVPIVAHRKSDLVLLVVRVETPK